MCGSGGVVYYMYQSTPIHRLIEFQFYRVIFNLKKKKNFIVKCDRLSVVGERTRHNAPSLLFRAIHKVKYH
jgi:hypothetical protein